MNNLEIIRNIIVDAEVSSVEEEDQYKSITASFLESVDQTQVTANDAMLELYKDLKTAAPEPVVDGRPRMLHISAVIVHEGVNRNGDGFYADDLKKVVNEKRLFKEGYGGMIDINHDYMPVGYWYDAEYITDPATNTAAILAKGAIWAWRFPEVADKILADQHRDGKINVSMSCMSKANEIQFDRAEDGSWIQWNRNPVFIATTVLFDQSPGDPGARGVADEDPVQITDTERKSILFKAAAQNDNSNIMEENMLEEFKPLLEDKLGDSSKAVIDAITASISSLEEKLDARANEVETLETEKSELSEQNATLQTTVEEQKISLEELSSNKEELEGVVAELTAKVEEFEAAEAAAAFERKKESRLADLSDSVKERLMAREESVREAILDRWANQTDEEWEVTKAEHALASTETSKMERLPGGARGSEETGATSLDKYLR